MFRSPLIDAIVVIVIVLLIMGPKRLPQLGKGLGHGMREFKEGITGESKGEDEKPPLTEARSTPDEDPQAQPTTSGRDSASTSSEPRP